MKAKDCAPGARVRVPGLELTLEVRSVSASRVRVQPTRIEIHEFLTRTGQEVKVRMRPKPFSIAPETIVEEVS